MPNRPATGDEQRTFLAGERTLLAWLRTSLALMGFGFLVAKFGLFLRELVAMRSATAAANIAASNPAGTGLSLWMGVTLVALGLAVNVFAVREHLRFIRQFAGTELAQRDRWLPHVALLLMLAVVGAVMCAYLVYFGREAT